MMGVNWDLGFDISDLRFEISDFRSPGGGDLRFEISDLKSAITQLSRGLGVSMPSGLSRYSQRRFLRSRAAAAVMPDTSATLAIRQAAKRRVVGCVMGITKGWICAETAYFPVS